MSVNKLIKRFISKFNFTVNRKVNQTRFKIPLLNAVGALNLRSNEKWMEQLLSKLLAEAPDSIFVDVGINIGQTLLKIKSVNINIPYYGFEPNPVCNYYVQALIKANRLKNCNVFPVGLSDAIDIKQLYIFSEGDISSASGSTVADLFENAPVQTEHIPVFTLDYFAEKYFKGKNLNILKVDVENGELEVLKGAVHTIQQFNPFIITEILPIVNRNTVDKTNARKAEMQQVMAKIGYTFYKIIINTKDEFVGFKLIKDLAAETAELSELHYDFNYLIAPASKHSFIDMYKHE